MIEAILVLLTALSVYFVGVSHEKSRRAKKDSLFKKEINDKEKEIHEEVSSSSLQSLVDSNNAKLEGK